MSSEEKQEGCGGARAKRYRDHGPPNRWSSWQQENHFAYPMWPRGPPPSMGPRAPGLMPHHHQVLMEHQPFGSAYGHCGFNGNRPRYPYNASPHLTHYNNPSGLYTPQGRTGGFDHRPNGDWHRYGNQAVQHGKRREPGGPHRTNQEPRQGSFSHQNGRRNYRNGWKNSRRHPTPPQSCERQPTSKPDDGGSAANIPPPVRSLAGEARERLEDRERAGRMNNRHEDPGERSSTCVGEGQEVGAVGGAPAEVPWEPDKNWVDEGAICDLDRMFQNQENSLLNADCSNGVGISTLANLGLRPPTQSNCVVTFSDEEDSDLENYESGAPSTPNGVLSSPEKAQLALSHSVPGGRFDPPSPPRHSAPGSEEAHDRQALDDAEDTGDFIDTDLPSHNKHLLSSSDEDTDSLSSHPPSEGEEQELQSDLVLPHSDTSTSPCRGNGLPLDSLTGSTHTHNDLSSLQVLQGDFENISLLSGQSQAFSLSSQGEGEHLSTDQPRRGRGDSDSSSFSESENGDPPLSSRSRPCMEGAAASQLSPLDKPPEAPPRAAVPCLGASWELPPLPQPGIGPQTASSGLEWEHTAEAQGAGTCWEVPRAVNDLNVGCHPHPGLMVMANGLSPPPPSCGANFSNDEINRHQKVFMKFPMGRGSHSASASADTQEYDNVHLPGKKHEMNYDKGGSEDPLRPGCEERVELVFLPMEEEVESPHPMSGAGAEEHLYVDNQEHSHLPLGCEHVFQIWPQETSSLARGDTAEPVKAFNDTDNYLKLLDKKTSRQSPAVEQLSPPDSPSLRVGLDHAMIWSEDEAFVMQYKQIATSACGPTALLNVMKALKLSCDKTVVSHTVQSSLRKESACIPEYLFSRACAGTTAEDLLVGVEKLSGGTVGGRFFHFWPPRKVNLLHWLAHWIHQGAVPIATLNLQKGSYSVMQVPDSWHHQMVYGVCPQGVYLTNPLEIVSERSALRQLCSDSVLMVRRQDVVSRFRQSTDLRELLRHPDPRWRTMNVLGQVVNVLRECNLPSVPGYRLQVTSHITIPAAYKSGITLFMRKDSPSWETLVSTPDLTSDV